MNEDSQTRAYLSNVCVAKELQKKGLGYALVDKSKKLAREWGKFIAFSVVDPLPLQQQQQYSLFSQASWGRLEMKPERNKFKVQAH